MPKGGGSLTTPEKKRGSGNRHPLKIPVIVLAGILALMLGYLTVRHFVCAGTDVPAENAAAPEKTAPEPEPEPEPDAAPEPEAPEEPAVPLDHEAIQAEVERVAEEYGAMGMQVALINDGAVVGSYACGWATYDSDPMTTAHKIRVASVSKVVVGMAAMALAEDGTVDLDESIGKYWGVEAVNPAFPDEPVSIRNILSHTSTIGAYSDYNAVGAGTIRSRLGYGYMNSKPGDLESWCYNNYAFGVLGSTLELAAGQTLDEVLYEQFFDALDIDASFAYGDVDDTDLLATIYRGYSVEQSLGFEKSLHLSDTPGENALFFAGSLTISAEDLAKLIAILANDGVCDGRQLLQSESVREMERHFTLPLEDGSYQAHPLLYVPGIYGRRGVYYHPGTAYGVYSCVSYDPQTGDGVVVITTGASGTADRYEIYNVCDEINEYLYELVSHPIDLSAGKTLPDAGDSQE